MNKTVFLCGFMGCGKSTVGRVLADMLGCVCTDMDSFIEKEEGMKISEIFSEKGEDYFRKCETEAVKTLGKKGGVIACGGGAMLKEENAEAAASAGVVVYIDTPYEICWERISGDTSRPIVMANTKESLEALYNTRAALYKAHSQICIDGSKSPVEIARSVKASIL